MKKFTVCDLARILDLDENTVFELDKNFRSYSEDLQYETLSILWSAVHELKNKLADAWYEIFLNEVEKGLRKLTDDLYKQALRMAWVDVEKLSEGIKIDFVNLQISKIEDLKKIRDIAEKKEEDEIEKLKWRLKEIVTGNNIKTD